MGLPSMDTALLRTLSPFSRITGPVPQMLFATDPYAMLVHAK